MQAETTGDSMSLYNALFGKNPRSKMLLATLGLTEGDVPRFRDCYLDGEHICIHTRTGGGNREDYEAENASLQAHRQYVEDADDDFDCTYATFRFSFPDAYSQDLKALSSGVKEPTPSEKWVALLSSMEKASAS